MIRNRAHPGHVREILGHEDFRSLDVTAKLVILDLKAAQRKCHPREQKAQGDDPPEETAGTVPVRKGRDSRPQTCSTSARVC